MGRSRGGLTTKIHAVVDTNGLPVRLALTTGEAHDNRLVQTLLSALKSGAMLLADRGFDADWMGFLSRRYKGVGQCAWRAHARFHLDACAKPPAPRRPTGSIKPHQ
jgi:transposase